MIRTALTQSIPRSHKVSSDNSVIAEPHTQRQTGNTQIQRRPRIKVLFNPLTQSLDLILNIRFNSLNMSFRKERRNCISPNLMEIMIDRKPSRFIGIRGVHSMTISSMRRGRINRVVEF